MMASVPDDEDGCGGFVIRGSEDHSNLPGLPGLQQQTQDTLSHQFLLVLTSLHKNVYEENKQEVSKRYVGRAKTGSYLGR